jgi:hypothetical protein
MMLKAIAVAAAQDLLHGTRGKGWLVLGESSLIAPSISAQPEQTISSAPLPSFVIEPVPTLRRRPRITLASGEQHSQ